MEQFFKWISFTEIKEGNTLSQQLVRKTLAIKLIKLATFSHVMELQNENPCLRN
jgi:hypothetical protein